MLASPTKHQGITMLIAGSALTGCAIEANDGRIETVKTLLFDDTTWKIRWLVIDAGHWLTGRQVLVHPSAIGTANHRLQHLPVNLTKSQLEASPDIRQDKPVTMQMESHLYSYYGWDPYWGPDFYDADIAGFGMIDGYGMSDGGAHRRELDTSQRGSDAGDPHLRRLASVQGYHIHATDGSIGHVGNFLLDDATWTIRYMLVDTRNWWFGAHVLIAPYAVRSIDWNSGEIRLNVMRAQVKTSPPWEPVNLVETMDERGLHEHYGWPGYGW
jgi:hypothetical protein